MKLQCCFDRCPLGIRVVFGDDDGDLVADVDAEVGHASEQDAVFSGLSLDVVRAVMLRERADDLFAWDGADLFVNETAVISNGELEDVTFDELGLACIVGRYWIRLAIRASHDLTVEDAFDDFAADFFTRTVTAGYDLTIVADDADKEFFGCGQVGFSLIDEAGQSFDLFLW